MMERCNLKRITALAANRLSGYRRKGIALSACVALLASCQTGALWDYDKKFREQVQIPLEAGMSQISQYYVREIDREDLVLNSLTSLSAIDPSLDVQSLGNSLILSVHDTKVGEYPKPASSSPTLWARLASRIIRDARENSWKVEQISHEELLSQFLNTGLQSVDPYSRYYGPRETVRIARAREGYSSVALTAKVDDSQIQVATVREDSDAAKLGIQPGDSILEIDGTATRSLSLTDIQQMLDGPAGSKVRLLIHQHKLNQSIELSLTRKLQVPNSVFVTNSAPYPTIQINVFNAETADRFKSVVTSLKSNGDTLPGLILDLRGNPGGLLDQSIEIADMILEEGDIVKASGRHYSSNKKYEATSGDILDGKPLIVLVDGSTASAAEILAAALQDNRRAVVVGSISYGKGAVQIIKNLPNKGELDLTWAYYVTAGKYLINEYGVLPTICTVGHENGIAAVLVTLRKRALKTRTDFHALRKLQAIGPVDGNGNITRFRNSCSWQADDSRDREQEAALTLLNDLSLYQDALMLPLPTTPGS